MNVGDLFVLAVALLAIAYGSLAVRHLLERREARQPRPTTPAHSTEWLRR